MVKRVVLVVHYVPQFVERPPLPLKSPDCSQPTFLGSLFNLLVSSVTGLQSVVDGHAYGHVLRS